MFSNASSSCLLDDSGSKQQGSNTYLQCSSLKHHYLTDFSSRDTILQLGWYVQWLQLSLQHPQPTQLPHHAWKTDKTKVKKRVTAWIEKLSYWWRKEWMGKQLSYHKRWKQFNNYQMGSLGWRLAAWSFQSSCSRKWYECKLLWRSLD